MHLRDRPSYGSCCHSDGRRQRSAAGARGWPPRRDTCSRWSPWTARKGVVHTRLRSAMNACDASSFSHCHHDDDFEELEGPGQWCLNRSARVLIFMPRDGETLECTQAAAPRFDGVAWSSTGRSTRRGGRWVGMRAPWWPTLGSWTLDTAISLSRQALLTCR